MSTLAEQIAWCRSHAEGGSDTARDVLATLEGMAAPGDKPDIDELLNNPPPPNEALTKLLITPPPRDAQDPEIVEIQDEHHASRRLKPHWVIVDNGDGNFSVHEYSRDSVWPSTDYPNMRLAAGRLLQLLGIGPVAPQSYPESVCIDALTVEATTSGDSPSPQQPTPDEIRTVATAICKSRTCEGINCCQWPANRGRTQCPVTKGGYDDAARDAIAAINGQTSVRPHSGWKDLADAG